MTTALEHVRYSCGIAGEEVANYVDQLQAKISELEEEIERLNAELANYRDAPVVAWSHLVKGLTFVETYAGSKPLIVKPGE